MPSPEQRAAGTVSASSAEKKEKLDQRAAFSPVHYTEPLIIPNAALPTPPGASNRDARRGRLR